MRELAHHCGSTALALSMHQHVTNFTAWRYRRELPGRRGDAAAHRRRPHRARVDRRRRLRAPPRRGRPRRRRLQGERAQDLRQPVAGRHGDVDDVPVRGSRARAARAQHGRAVQRPGRHRARQLGHPRDARHGEQRRDDRRRVRPRRAGARRPPLRRRRSAAAGDRQHRLPDHRCRLPRRRRVGSGGGDRHRHRAAAGERPDRCSGRSG